MKIARVFPRQTSATPTDSMAFFDVPPMLGLPEIEEVHVSVAFTWDMAKAEWLAHQWEIVGVPVKLGGPAFNLPSGDFVPGMYLKHGSMKNVCLDDGSELGICEKPFNEGRDRLLTAWREAQKIQGVE